MREILAILLIVWVVPVVSQDIPKNYMAVVRSAYGNDSIEVISCEEQFTDIDDYNARAAWRVGRNGEPYSYLFHIECMGRTIPFQSLVLIARDGSVLAVRVVEYTSTHGVRVTNRRWLSQLQVPWGTPIIYGQNVDAISGATLSAKSLIEGVTKAQVWVTKGGGSKVMGH